ncbi:DNA/RNA helicase [Bacillus sp. V3-13]|uniref:DEAD/DEAH box helicase n=1 Tax=Bacillus sp. V3-13 TaxID=2053728 RepID=UPI000C779D1E|nr:DEAD/DEAH box helicase [Bacillus sp. V3-13]PLR78251.1 DNA/RNA helicase [Bacillus sp. V3-13]
MRFALLDSRLIPEPLLNSSMTTSPISRHEDVPRQPINTSFSINADMQAMLAGKQLLLDELPYPLDLIQAHYEAGYLIYRKGITVTKNSAKCMRCGNSESRLFATFPCARCGEQCLYCRKCMMIGRITACTPLISWTGPRPHHKGCHSPLSWNGTLSEGQSAASAKVVDAIKRDEELLIWAVCGAGKTEVLFAGINEALTQGKRVCIATPRTDVVLELTPRLKNVFPRIEIAALYGGSEDRHLQSQLAISTTHQLLRFYEAFDTVIVDEVDAFPYSVDETLQYAVKQSRKSTSSMIYLTATPNEKWQAECIAGKRAFVTIPARYHRYPLPVPEFSWCGNWKKLMKKGRLPENVLLWLKNRLNSNKQALLFSPRIDSMEKILPILRKLHENIQAVHAEDPQRKEKVQAMRDGKVSILLTTTILERGVTFPNIDVAVLGAEERIFTESALVQISGRVGRSEDFPDGNITFFHYGKTEEMVKARKQIIKMNKEAARKGMLR